MRYVVLPQHESDGGYAATVPALPGCVSQGDTREEALKNIKEEEPDRQIPDRQGWFGFASITATVFGNKEIDKAVIEAAKAYVFDPLPPGCVSVIEMRTTIMLGPG